MCQNCPYGNKGCTLEPGGGTCQQTQFYETSADVQKVIEDSRIIPPDRNRN